MPTVSVGRGFAVLGVVLPPSEVETVGFVRGFEPVGFDGRCGLVALGRSPMGDSRSGLVAPGFVALGLVEVGSEGCGREGSGFEGSGFEVSGF
ncbi:MAG: hypothetical protein LW636_08935, partial [Planctomycetaceae bacterium]|nr:hypothetical protein [Planctomycetaceae bacterium]